MVVTGLFPTALIGVWQDRIGSPSRCTVQAPHSAIPQPNLVPVRPSASRNTHRRGVCGSTSTSTGLPFTLILSISTSRPETGLTICPADTLQQRKNRRAVSLRAKFTQGSEFVRDFPEAAHRHRSRDHWSGSVRAVPGL